MTIWQSDQSEASGPENLKPPPGSARCKLSISIRAGWANLRSTAAYLDLNPWFCARCNRARSATISAVSTRSSLTWHLIGRIKYLQNVQARRDRADLQLGRGEPLPVGVPRTVLRLPALRQMLPRSAGRLCATHLHDSLLL